MAKMSDKKRKSSGKTPPYMVGQAVKSVRGPRTKAKMSKREGKK